MKENCQDLTCK